MEKPGIPMVALQGKGDQDEANALKSFPPVPKVDAPAEEDNESRDDYDEDYDEDEGNAAESFHIFTLHFVQPDYENSYEEYYWNRLRGKFKMYSGLMMVLFAIYIAVLIPLTEENENKNEVLIFQLVLVFFPMLVMLVFGNNHYLPHSVALILNCAVFVLSTVGAILSVGLLYYSHLHHPIVYAGLFFIIGCVMPNFYIPFIHSIAVDCVILALYFVALGLSKDGFSHELAPFSLIMFTIAIGLNIWISRDSEIQMRLEFLYAYKVEIENRKLKEKVWTLENPNGEKAIVGNVNVDLESPIEKAIAVLNDLITRSAQEDANNLRQVLEVISQHQDMLKPSIEKQIEEGGKEVDKEIQDWLFYELAQKENKKTMAHSDSWTLNKKQEVDGARRASALSILPNMSKEEEDRLMSVIGNSPWNWDMFELSKTTRERPLYFVTLYLFKKYDFLTKFKVDEAKLQNFISDVEEGYEKKNAYHNNMHAADVLLSVHHLLTTGKLSRHISDLELFAALLAACVHDYKHPGFNNAFQINTFSSKALIYNDKSVLENYHISASWMLMKKPKNNILEGLDDTQRKTVRKVLIDMILATDMAVHFETVGDLKSKLIASKNELNLEDARTKDLMLKVALKVADIGHTAKSLSLHEKWTDRVQNEFYVQGDEEKKLGIPVSPFMDRDTSNIPKSQVGFINFVVLPLFDSFNYCKDYDPLLDQLRSNQRFWEEKLRTETAAPATTNTASKAH